MKSSIPRIILYIAFAISFIAIITIAIVIAPHEDSVGRFWYGVVWSECLNLFFWFSLITWTSQSKPLNIIGIPSLSIIVMCTCLISFSLMIVDYMNASAFLHKYQIVLQVILVTLSILICLGIYLASYYARVDMEMHTNLAVSPLDLSTILVTIEKKLISIDDLDSIQFFARNIKALRERIKYSFQDTAKTRSNSVYKQYSLSIYELCNDINNSVVGNNIQKDKIKEISEKTTNLTLKIDEVLLSIRNS